MKLGMQVGLGPSHIALDGNPAPPSPKGHSPPIFGPYLLRPNGCMDQDVTWYGARPQPRRLCVRWDPAPPSPKGEHSPKFSAHVYCGQTAAWIRMPCDMQISLNPSNIVLDGDLAPPTQRGTVALPNFFRLMSIVTKRLHGSGCLVVCR